MQTIRTTRCAQSGQPEVTLLLDGALPVPDLEQHLVRYFEDATAAGSVFKPGQTVLFGSSLLRLSDRADGTLAVHGLGANGAWVESVTSALMRTWLQQEVARSVGLTPSFAHQGMRAVVCRRAVEEARPLYYLRRDVVERSDDSGWFLSCGDPKHDHDEASALAGIALHQLADQVPVLEKYLALPPNAEAFLSVRRSGRVFSELCVDRKPLTPAAGSYLEAMNREAG